MNKGVIIILGMGEVGQPLFQILSRKFQCVPVDMKPVEIKDPCDVLHICYPFQVPDFIKTTARYMEKYNPCLTAIHSTVAPGTTRKIHEAAPDRALVYSPVRGKHTRMESDMLRYKKFVSGFDAKSVEAAERHFREGGFQTDTFPTPDVAELSKLLETTYFGVLIGWAQEVERLAVQHGGNYDDVVAQPAIDGLALIGRYAWKGKGELAFLIRRSEELRCGLVAAHRPLDPIHLGAGDRFAISADDGAKDFLRSFLLVTCWNFILTCRSERLTCIDG